MKLEGFLQPDYPVLFEILHYQEEEVPDDGEREVRHAEGPSSLGAAGVDCLGLASPLLDSGEVVHEAGLGVVELPVVHHLGLLEPQVNPGRRRLIRA